MCELKHIEKCVEIFKANNCPFELMHCISAYPFDDYRVTVMVDYNSQVLGSQHHTLNKIDNFKKDIIGANNTAEDPRPYTDLFVGGSNSGIGFVDSVTIDTGMYTNSRANSGTPFAANGGFSNGQYIFEANQNQVQLVLDPD